MSDFNERKKMAASEYPPPVKVDLMESPERKSNFIYRWFQHQQGIENLEHRIIVLEAELKASKNALKERLDLLETIKEEIAIRKLVEK